MFGIGVVKGDSNNPYNWIDYKWGGFGPQYWFILPEVHPSNVWEKKYATIKKERVGDCDVSYHQDVWDKVWDNEQQKWREISVEEHTKLPVLKPYTTRVRWNWDNVTWQFPFIKSAIQNVPIMTELMSVQPMMEPNKS